MTESETIKQEIEVAKAALASKVETLETQVRDLASPTHYIKEYPFLSMGLAVGAGLVVSTQMNGGKKLLQPVAMGLFSLLVSGLEKKYLAPGLPEIAGALES